MSARIVVLVSLREGVGEAEASELASRLGRSAAGSDEVSASHAGVHCAGSVGGGDLTWDLFFEDDGACDAFCESAVGAAALLAASGAVLGELGAAVASLDPVRLEEIAHGVARPGAAGIKRTNCVRALPEAPRAQVAQWERECQLLPVAVPAIRNWCFSRVRPLPALPTRWTHVWEQEFDGLAGLEVDYMASPYHWGHLDGWYDLEHPKCVIDPWLAHLYCPATASVLSWGR